jgi:hypothetical protein
LVLEIGSNSPKHTTTPLVRDILRSTDREALRDHDHQTMLGPPLPEIAR